MQAISPFSYVRFVFENENFVAVNRWLGSGHRPNLPLPLPLPGLNKRTQKTVSANKPSNMKIAADIAMPTK